MTSKIHIVNRDSSLSFRYNIIQRIECGISLLGSEVKSLRTHSANVKGAFCTIAGNGLVIHNLNIPKYKYCFKNNHIEKRDRLLLIKKKQVLKLRGEIHKKGIHLLTEQIYFNEKNLAKITVCLCQIAKQQDLREKIKARDIKRELHSFL